MESINNNNNNNNKSVVWKLIQEMMKNGFDGKKSIHRKNMKFTNGIQQ